MTACLGVLCDELERSSASAKASLLISVVVSAGPFACSTDRKRSSAGVKLLQRPQSRLNSSSPTPRTSSCFSRSLHFNRKIECLACGKAPFSHLIALVADFFDFLTAVFEGLHCLRAGERCRQSYSTVLCFVADSLAPQARCMHFVLTCAAADLGSSGARQLRWFQGGVAHRAWEVDRLGHERVDASQVRAHF